MGFHIFIGEPSEFPVLADRGTLLDTGRETNIDISGEPEIIESTDILHYINVSGEPEII